jgi:hypothetical protein
MPSAQLAPAASRGKIHGDEPGNAKPIERIWKFEFWREPFAAICGLQGGGSGPSETGNHDERRDRKNS